MKSSALAILLLVSSAAGAAISSLPAVDLGYVQQRATEYNTTNGLYIYKNVRYARPPLGDLRFRKPQPPLQESAGTISDGSQYTTTICPQAAGSGTPSANGFSEDCLFLDVYVPSDVNAGDDVPVFVWIYGGGYVVGSKEDAYMHPSGLFRTAGKPMIFVALNYRLGAFGWASPPSETSIVPNVGLHDARAALNWVQQYISKFGGNPSDVTLFGESAGGGVIMHTITAYGGASDPPPFQKAIVQSPGFVPARGNLQGRDDKFNTFMAQANCSDVACLRSAPTETLMDANSLLTQNSISSGSVGFVVVVDGEYVPDLPGKLFLEGRYHKNLTSVITANNQYEGRFFLPSPDNVTTDTFNSYLSQLVPNMTSAGQDAARALYLNTTSQESIWDRTVALISDIQFTCNAQVIASSYATHNDNTYRYIYAVPPAKHGDDVYYSFYNYGNSSTDAEVGNNTSVAFALQNIITSLGISGVPEYASSVPMEQYGGKETVLVLNVTEIGQHSGDPWQSERCTFWQEADYVQG